MFRFLAYFFKTETKEGSKGSSQDEDPGLKGEIMREPTIAELAVIEAERLWSIGILDTQIINGKKYSGDLSEIENIIATGGGEFWERRMRTRGGYSEKKGDEWCGFFASCCFRNLHPKIRKYVIPSCFRLYSSSKWKQAGFSKPKWVPPKKIQAGDIVVIYNRRHRNVDSKGDHICLAVSSCEEKTFRTIEGNATGFLPDGNRGEGVIKNIRKLSEVAFVYRLGPEHMVKEHIV